LTCRRPVPASGVVNVDAPPDLAAFVQMLWAVADQNRGDLLGMWATLGQGYGIDRLPREARELLVRNSRTRADLIASYWEAAATVKALPGSWFDLARLGQGEQGAAAAQAGEPEGG
jgi:hypothetical protein